MALAMSSENNDILQGKYCYSKNWASGPRSPKVSARNRRGRKFSPPITYILWRIVEIYDIWKDTSGVFPVLQNHFFAVLAYCVR